MAIAYTKFCTITCDIPDCKDQLTAANPDLFWDKGWVQDMFLGVEKALCPDHVKSLKEFFDED